jgi:hypothetical protein
MYAMSKQNPLNTIRPIHDEQMLVTRDQARLMLGGVASITIIRLEAAGVLKAVRLSPGDRAKVFYRRADVVAVTETNFTKNHNT